MQRANLTWYCDWENPRCLGTNGKHLFRYIHWGGDHLLICHPCHEKNKKSLAQYWGPQQVNERIWENLRENERGAGPADAMEEDLDWNDHSNTFIETTLDSETLIADLKMKEGHYRKVGFCNSQQIGVPAHWIDMNNGIFKVLTVQEGDIHATLYVSMLITSKEMKMRLNVNENAIADILGIKSDRSHAKERQIVVFISKKYSSGGGDFNFNVVEGIKKIHNKEELPVTHANVHYLEVLARKGRWGTNWSGRSAYVWEPLCGNKNDADAGSAKSFALRLFSQHLKLHLPSLIVVNRKMGDKEYFCVALCVQVVKAYGLACDEAKSILSFPDFLQAF